jgi:hypothetical protein
MVACVGDVGADDDVGADGAGGAGLPDTASDVAEGTSLGGLDVPQPAAMRHAARTAMGRRGRRARPGGRITTCVRALDRRG